MTSKEKINSIKCVINEFYHDMNCKGNLTECANECWKEYQQFCEDIKQDLERLEQLEDNIKIHKETIKMQHNQIESLQSNLKCSQENEEAVLTTLNSETDEIEKLKKVIEILKDKFIHHFIKYAKSLTEYNKFIRNSEYDKLTQKEFELLKEHFGNEN